MYGVLVASRPFSCIPRLRYSALQLVPALITSLPPRLLRLVVMAHCLSRSWLAWPRAIPDQDPDAPDDQSQPSPPLTVLAKRLSSVTNHFYYYCIIFSVVLVPLLFLVWQVEQFRASLTACKRRLEQFRASLTASIRHPNLQSRRRISLGCHNSQSSPSDDQAAFGHSRLLENFLAYLKDALKTTTMTIMLRITIKALLWIDVGIWAIDVFKTFKRFHGIFAKDKNQDLAMQQTSILCTINLELRDAIFAKLDYKDIFNLQVVCKAFNNVMKSDTFKVLCKPREGWFGPNVFYVENATSTNNTWQWISYDIITQQWQMMPSFASLPTPNVALFKDYFVAGGCGIMCVDVGKYNYEEELVVYQPLTREKTLLPHLIHRRRPVLIHVIVNDAKSTYKIIVAGCSSIATKHLSRKTEVYDSSTKCWTESDDIPGPDFALNEYQTGVYVKSLDTLYCIGFLPSNEGRGILAFNVGKKMWMRNAFYQLPNNSTFNEMYVAPQVTIAQLVEYDDEVFLFSEQETSEDVTHSIHKLLKFNETEDLSDDGDELGKVTPIWEQVLCESRNGSRALLANPEFECLPHGKNQFCIFNTVERCGTLYTFHFENDILTTTKQKLPTFPRLKENSLIFQSQNSLGFAFELSFKISL